jgi:hypothetical protein
MNDFLRKWPKSLTYSKGSIILKPTWDRAGGARLALAFEKSLPPCGIGYVMPPEGVAPCSDGAAVVWQGTNGRGKFRRPELAMHNATPEDRKKFNAYVDFPAPLG